MKYAIEQSFARYENGKLLECRFVVKNRQGKVLYRCNNLISAQKEVERLLKEQNGKKKQQKKEFEEFIKNKRVKKMNQIFNHSCHNMQELEDNSVDLIITSPPYFNIKDYSKSCDNHAHDIGAIDSYHDFIDSLLKVWIECERVLKPNAKLCINVPLMPMLKKDLDTHYNRHIFNLQSDIQQSILANTKLFLYDLYIWNRIYQTRDLMFGSYPYPRNFYSQNTSEFIVVFVKDGKPEQVDKERKEASKLTQKEWVDYTKQIWDIPPPDKSDLAWGIHPAIMPKEIPYRLIRLFSFVGDIVLDPFTGSGTTLAMASQLERRYVGYELYENYAKVARLKIASAKTLF